MAGNRTLTWIINPDDTSFDSRFFKQSELLENATENTSGASKIGVNTDNIDHSSSNLIQDVLKDLDSAIGTAMSGGEVNTASNVNTSGIGIFKDKNLYDLEFKGIKSSDQHFTVSESLSDNTIDIISDASATSGSSTLVARDGSGNFAAGTITADLSGNASTATQLENSRTIQISGDGTASGISFDGTGDVNLSLTVDKVDGKDVDDNQSSTGYLWTAGKIINYITGKINGLDWQESVKSKVTLDPPSSPVVGDRYIIPSGATGAWTGQTHKITEWSGTVWNFITPTEGCASWVENEDKNYTYNGSSWVTFGSTQNHNNMSGLQGGTTNQYYHLTASQLTSLTSPNCDVHTHDDRYYTESESDSRFLGINAKSADSNKLDGIDSSSFLRSDISSSPTTNNTLNLGDVNHVWANIHATTFNGTCTLAKYADLAEKYTFENSDNCSIGDVVVVSGNDDFDCKVSDELASNCVIGVISDKPAYMMNANLEGGIYVALKGRVMCKVQGPVKKRDSLVSNYNGTARVCPDNLKLPDTKFFAIANEKIETDEIKLIEVIL